MTIFKPRLWANYWDLLIASLDRGEALQTC
jgi:hypothetical protein